MKIDLSIIDKTKVDMDEPSILTVFKVKSIKIKELFTQGEWGYAVVLFEEIIKIGRIFKTQAVGNVCHAPVGIVQQCFRFVGYTF